MNAEVSQPVADLAVKGALAVEPCVVCADLAEATGYHGFCEVHRDAQHLVPVVSLPKCLTCDGSGTIIRPWGDYSRGSSHRLSCPDCTGGWPIGQRITLTTKGKQRVGSGTRPNWDEIVQVPRVEGTLRAVLEVHLQAAEGHNDGDHICVGTNGMWYVTGPPTIDVSHLRDLCDWSGWAVLLTDLSPA